jgi:hypothetical protein
LDCNLLRTFNKDLLIVLEGQFVHPLIIGYRILLGYTWNHLDFEHYSYGYGQKINAVTQVSQQKTKVTKNFSKNLLCYKKSILQ